VPHGLCAAVIERTSQVPEGEESRSFSEGEQGSRDPAVSRCLCSSALAEAGTRAPRGDGSGSVQFSPPPAPGWQTSLLAAKPLGQPLIEFPSLEKLLRKEKRVKTNIVKTCQVAAGKRSAASRPEASRV